MRRRTGETEEELENEAEERPPVNGDLGAILMGVQDSAGNAALAGLVAQVESGQVPPESLLPGGKPDKDAERERQGIKERATNLALTQRLTNAKAHPRAPRIEGELTAFERRLRDAREYGWLGMDAAALGAEMAELEDKLGARGGRGGGARRARGASTCAASRSRSALKKAIMERTAIAKPGMALYAPEDLEGLMELHDELAELQKALTENAHRGHHVAPDARQPQRRHDRVRQERRRQRSRDAVEKIAVKLTELELKLSEITDRHARANAEDRERLNQLMEGLEPRLRRDPRVAMAGGSSRQEIDYLIKKAWLEQHEQTQQLAKDEVWELVAGFSPDEGRVAYFDLPGAHGRVAHPPLARLRRHEGRRRRVLGVRHPRRDHGRRAASVVFRSHATAEVLGRSDDRNPHYYYGTGKVTPKKDFWSTREGKAAKRNWSALQGELIDAFNTKTDEFVKLVAEVLEQRRELKATVVKVGESLQWAE